MESKRSALDSRIGQPPIESRAREAVILLIGSFPGRKSTISIAGRICGCITGRFLGYAPIPRFPTQASDTLLPVVNASLAAGRNPDFSRGGWNDGFRPVCIVAMPYFLFCFLFFARLFTSVLCTLRSGVFLL